MFSVLFWLFFGVFL
uniref:Uncharacterized protein n=1 Tax=Arundo donax TaxID=35708 RepID=A0A0A8YK71_ARUDO